MFRILVYTIILFAAGYVLKSCSNNKKQNTLSEVEFTQLYLDSLKVRNPTVDFKIDSILTISSSKDIVHYLDNIYRAYNNEPTALKDILYDYLNASDASYKSIPYDKNQLIPIIKSNKYIDDLKSLGKGDFHKEIYYENYNSDLIILYAIDGDHNISYLNKESLDTLNIKTDTLQNFAFNNLRKLIPTPEIVGGEGKFGIVAGGNFESSLILSKIMWNKDNFPVNGDIVIAIPTREMIYTVGSNDKEAIDKLRITTKESFENDNYQVSPYLYKYDGKMFVRYDK